MSIPFSLEPDEGIVLNDEDLLVLTNKRLVKVEMAFGLFKRTQSLNEVPLHTIKVINGEAQVFLTEDDDDWAELEIYTFDGDCLSYDFDEHDEARQWADTISTLLVGHPSAQAAQAARAYEEARAMTGLEGVISSVGEFAGALSSGLSLKATEMRRKSAAASAKANAPAFASALSFDAPSAQVVPDAAAAPQQIEQAAAAVEGQPGVVPEQAGAMPLDEQIAMVKSLKELLDAGILTQEEFDQKKREVMGL